MESDGASSDFRCQRGDGDMAFFGIKDQTRMDLVATDEQVVPLSQRRQLDQLFFRPDPPHRVMRVAEQKKSGVRRDRPFHCTQIHLPA